MRRRQFVKFIGGVALAWPLNARAQPAGKLYCIGYFNAGAAAAQGGVGLERAFVEALRELGWMEGKNIAFEYRFAEGHSDRLPGMATELVHLKVSPLSRRLLAIHSGAGLLRIWRTQAGMSQV